jgi:short-subunit dehydrogenase
VGFSNGLADEFAAHGVKVTAVLPTFTNTELVSGTSHSAGQKWVQPTDVAAAIVKVLDKPKSQVSVPGWGRLVGIMTVLLRDRSRRWLSKRTGMDTVFLNLDTTARQGYEDRAQHATGVIEHKD